MERAAQRLTQNIGYIGAGDLSSKDVSCTADYNLQKSSESVSRCCPILPNMFQGFLRGPYKILEDLTDFDSASLFCLGTVEYLYNANENKFYFLELNPRLQVEHPVTEELTRVNLPATQVLVCCGVPLENIAQIRRFYGKSDSDTTSPINFLEDRYVYPDRHVIASRITAENPDDGFKPTSGKILGLVPMCRCISSIV